MSGKSSGTSSSRVRDNQRRCRRRRAERLQELQNRVYEYEQHGVAVAQQMQEAARKVVQENEQLRSLLALHGVSHEAVESYLHLSGKEGSSEVSLHTSGSLVIAPRLKNVKAEPPRPVGFAISKSSAQSQNIEIEKRRVTRSQLPLHRQHISPITNSNSIKASDANELPRAQSNIHEIPENDTGLQEVAPWHDINPETFDMESSAYQDSSSLATTSKPRVESRLITSGLEMSCETAATIIVEMRGNGDKDSVRASLGCDSQRGCKVKNTLVFEAMDRM